MIDSKISGPDFDNLLRTSKLATVSGADKMNRNLSNILNTPIGTRLYSPLFGSKLYMLKYEPITEVLMDLIKIYVLEAITTSEPRVKVLNVNVTKCEDETIDKYKNILYIETTYQIVDTSVVGTMIEKFVSEGGRVEDGN